MACWVVLVVFSSLLVVGFGLQLVYCLLLFGFVSLLVVGLGCCVYGLFGVYVMFTVGDCVVVMFACLVVCCGFNFLFAGLLCIVSWCDSFVLLV